MSRYILIDNESGYIFADSADINGGIVTGTPIEVCKAFDESIKEHGRSYEELNYNPRDNSAGYHVYRADIDSAEAVPVVHDGQDQETINNVTNLCRWECYVRCWRTAA